MTRNPSSSALKWLPMAMLVLALPFLTGCSRQVVTETRTVYIEVERLVPIDPALTYAQEPPDRPLEIWLDALVLMIEYRHRWDSCEIRMDEIRRLGNE